MGMGTFMMRSDLKVPTPAMPMPDLAVPYAAPRPVHRSLMFFSCRYEILMIILPNIMANATPAMPRKGANLGTKSSATESAMVLTLARAQDYGD